MKKIILLLLILVMAISMAAGCELGSGARENELQKEFQYEIKNVSGEDWVLIADFDTDFVYTGDNFGLDRAFTIKAGKSKSETFNAQRLIEAGRLEEKSKTTYNIDMRFIAGRVPNDPEQDIITKGLIMQDITITGTYGKNAVIEWDGANFKEVK